MFMEQAAACQASRQHSKRLDENGQTSVPAKALSYIAKPSCGMADIGTSNRARRCNSSHMNCVVRSPLQGVHAVPTRLEEVILQGSLLKHSPYPRSRRNVLSCLDLSSRPQSHDNQQYGQTTLSTPRAMLNWHSSETWSEAWSRHGRRTSYFSCSSLHTIVRSFLTEKHEFHDKTRRHARPDVKDGEQRIRGFLGRASADTMHHRMDASFNLNRGQGGFLRSYRHEICRTRTVSKNDA